jgi:hypothetical protein
VPIAFNAIYGFVALIPIMTILQGPTGRAVAAVLISTALAIVTNAANEADIAHAARVARKLKFLAAVPACWLIVQIIPLPHHFSNSIWEAAATALDLPLYQPISIDIGSTVGVLSIYLASIALILVAIFSARDRDRAELLLYCLCVTTTFTVIELWLFQVASNSSIGEFAAYPDMLAGAAAQGVVLNLAATFRTIARHKSWDSEKRLFRPALWLLLLCLISLAICLLAIGLKTSVNVRIATLFGVVTLCFEEVIRRGRLAAWTSLTLCATLLGILAMIVAWRYNFSESSFLTLRFAQAPADAVEAVQRMLLDTRWTGTGAGTFPALWPIYHDLGGTAAAQVPTTAASIMLGGGVILVVTAVAGTVVLFAVLFRGALTRGRDSLYPTVAAASIAVLFGEAFCDASLSTTGVALIVTILIGLGLTQSVSQGKG